MSIIHFKKTTATPEQFIAGLTDFGPGRGKLFGNSTGQYLKVHKKGTMLLFSRLLGLKFAGTPIAEHFAGRES
jgi:hypothetical protein